MLYEQALFEKQRLEQEISLLNQKIMNLPAGTIFCTHDKQLIKWYQSIDGKQTYISKANHTLAKQLASKKYYSLKLADLQQELTAVNFYLRHHKSDIGEKALQFSSRPEYKALLLPPIESLDWEHTPYPTNPQHPEHLIYHSTSGIMMRSKSETIIDMYLCMNHIPHRYECELILGEKILYPDFTIKHPTTGKISYWEHFGMIDKPGYRQNTSSKLQTYIAHQIFPGLQLITTYKSKNHPLDILEIQDIIRKNFL